jgi:uncharacterized membrane protein
MSVSAESVINYFKESIDIVKPNWLMLAVAVLVVAIIVGLATNILGQIGPIIMPLLTMPLIAGLLMLTRSNLNRETFDFQKLFGGFSNTPVLVNLLMLAAPSCALGLLQFLIIKSGMLFLSIPLLLVMVAYGIVSLFAVMRVIFAGRDAITALKESIPVVISNIVPVLVFFVLATIATLLGVLALLVGIFFVVPVVYTVLLRLHDAMFGHATAFMPPPAPPPPPGMGA